MTKDKLNAYEGLLFHFIKKIRPNLAGP